jgi:hypothetical protein
LGVPATGFRIRLVKPAARALFTNESPKRRVIYEALMLSATRRLNKGMRKQFE